MNGNYCPRCGRQVIASAAVEKPPVLRRDILNVPMAEISVLLDNIRSAYNVGSLIRTAEGAGLKHLYLGGITPSPEHPGVVKTALGSEKTLSYSRHSNGLDITKKLIASGHKLIALENIVESKNLFDTNLFHADISMVLVLGNEVAGIDPAIIDLCHDVVMVPMLGSKQSLNVVVAFAVAVYQIRFGSRN